MSGTLRLSIAGLAILAALAVVVPGLATGPHAGPVGATASVAAGPQPSPARDVCLTGTVHCGPGGPTVAFGPTPATGVLSFLAIGVATVAGARRLRRAAVPSALAVGVPMAILRPPRTAPSSV